MIILQKFFLPDKLFTRILCQPRHSSACGLTLPPLFKRYGQNYVVGNPKGYAIYDPSLIKIVKTVIFYNNKTQYFGKKEVDFHKYFLCIYILALLICLSQLWLNFSPLLYTNRHFVNHSKSI